jgi:uncharacterized protein YnzC (UPF0291/DUF896 family)
MVSKEKVTRINELARKSKVTTLSDDEKTEQCLLRQEYLEGFRENFKRQLEVIHFEDDIKDED